MRRKAEPELRVAVRREPWQIAASATCADCDDVAGLKGSALRADGLTEATLRAKAATHLLRAGWRADEDGDRCPACATEAP